MNPVMYLLSDPRIPMSKGKFGAQAAHAAVLAYDHSPDNWLKHVWLNAGGHYAKVVLQCDDLDFAQRYIEARGFQTDLIIDEGRTEFGDTLTPTFLGVQIVDKDKLDVKNTFGGFKLYKEPTQDTVIGWMSPSERKMVPVEGQTKRSLFTKIKERFHGNTSQRRT